jgi:hypothetical protein
LYIVVAVLSGVSSSSIPSSFEILVVGIMSEKSSFSHLTFH